MRPARVFLHGERPVCAKCGKPSFVVLGPLLVCDSKVHKAGERRTCGTRHYLLQHPDGHSVMVLVTREEAEAIKASESPGTLLSEWGVPQVARELLSGVRKAA